MAKSGTRPGWWRTGNVSARLVCLGAVLGAVGAVVFHASSTVGHLNAVVLLWGLVNLLVFEIPLMAILGLIVAGVVISARFLVTEAATRKTRAVVTGISALMSSGILAYAFCSLFPPLMSPEAIAAVTGVLVGGTFAAVSYRHTSQI
jgi:membrane associated rhomboid family serine protease